MMFYFHYIVPIVEVLIIMFMLNYFLQFFWGTRAMDVIVGFLLFLFFFFLSSYLGFPVLEKIMLNIVNVAVLAVLIIFQPELRIAFSKIRLKRTHRHVHEVDQFIEHLIKSIYRLSERQTGALIVLENHDSYDEYIHSAVSMNAEFSSELLESIFVTTSPLHDGAVVIRGTMIIAAGVILPLAQELSGLSKTMGTRHRAALGASQKTDALIIVISEETGKVSIARDGVITRGIKPDRFRGIVTSIFTPPEQEKPFKWKFWKA